MSSTTTLPPSTKCAPALRGACEKSARSVISVMRRETPGKASSESLADLVDSLTGVIERTAELLLAGKHVRVIEDEEAMTTQEAADMLNVSRPHLVKLLEEGVLPFHKTGKHRRVLFADLMGYREEREKASHAAMEALAQQAQDLRMGYE